MMSKRNVITFSISHMLAAACGFAAGIYVLPILIAPPAPDRSTVQEAAKNSDYVGVFSRDREDSDTFHWGEGEVSISSESISFMGKLAPGPDYKLYLSPEFVETERDFNRLKSKMVQVGDIKTFENFVVPLRREIDPSAYRALIVWCESFEQFITSGLYERRKK
jgi:hypothetical protein